MTLPIPKTNLFWLFTLLLEMDLNIFLWPNSHTHGLFLSGVCGHTFMGISLLFWLIRVIHCMRVFFTVIQTFLAGKSAEHVEILKGFIFLSNHQSQLLYYNSYINLSLLLKLSVSQNKTSKHIWHKLFL